MAALSRRHAIHSARFAISDASGFLLGTLWCLAVATGCGDGDEVDAAGGFQLPVECNSDTQVPPAKLVCTGLYADIAEKVIAPNVEAYSPAVPLWSDGTDKQRWIQIPPGEVIDNSDPNEWIFPVGTKAWKQFSLDERRVETRLWQKVEHDYWVAAAYAWDDDEASATRSRGGDIEIGDTTYHIPKSNECEDCHRGRTDRILGFEEVSLGLEGASGLTLEQLNAEERLSVPLDTTELSIGDDGTELAAPVLGWMHANCGTTCHNRNSDSKGWSADMFLRLEPAELDGRSLKRSDPLKTTIGISAVTPAFSGTTRIVPGDPEGSLLFELITQREKGRQMPPIASNLVDEDNAALIEEWIAALPALDEDDEDNEGGSGGAPADDAGGDAEGGASSASASAGAAGESATNEGEGGTSSRD
jgi:hypothetical protein